MSNPACLLGNLRPEKNADKSVIFVIFSHYILFALTMLSTPPSLRIRALGDVGNQMRTCGQ